MCTIRFGTVTERAIGIVAVDAISPITTFALSVLTSFVAASTDALACVWPSSEATSVTLDEPRPAERSALFWRSTASLTPRSRFAPYAARSPVNGSTSPIRSWNEHGLAVTALGAGRAVPARSAPTAANTATTATAVIFRVGRTFVLLPLGAGVTATISHAECRHSERNIVRLQQRLGCRRRTAILAAMAYMAPARHLLRAK